MKHYLLLCILISTTINLLGQSSYNLDSLYVLWGTRGYCGTFCENSKCSSKESVISIADFDFIKGTCSYSEIYENYEDKWFDVLFIDFNVDSLHRIKKRILGIEFSGVDYESKNTNIFFPNLLHFYSEDVKLIYDFLFKAKELRNLGINTDVATVKDIEQIFSLKNLESITLINEKGWTDLPNKSKIKCVESLRFLSTKSDLSKKANVKKLKKLREVRVLAGWFTGNNYNVLKHLDFINKIYITNLTEVQIKEFKDCCPNVYPVEFTSDYFPSEEDAKFLWE